MKRKTMALIIALIICSGLMQTGFCSAAAGGGDNVVSISTIDSRPMSIDRLLYTALADISYHAAVRSEISLQASYELADSGERDGVISAQPDMEALYPHLRRVPVVLDFNNINAFTLEGHGKINSWNSLKSLKVGILTQRLYIRERIPEGSEVITKETVPQLFAGLSDGQYDVVVLAQHAHEDIALPSGVVFSGTVDSLEEYLYLHESRAALIPAVTEALENVFEDGRGEMILNDIPVPKPDSKRTILHIISFNSELAREDRFTARMRSEMAGDDSIEWYSYALNSRRVLMDTNRITTIAQQLRQDLVSKNIAAIIVSGESAIKFIEEYYLLFFRNVPVIFYGMDNEFFSDTEKFAKQYTGIVETVSADETAELALKLFPDTKNIFVVNDHTEEGNDYRESIKKQLAPLADSVNIEYNEQVSRTALLERLEELPEDSIILLGSYFRDAFGQYFSQNEMRRAIALHSNAPVFTLYSSESESGAIGGKLPDYEMYAQLAVSQLRQILAGVPVSQLPLVNDSSYNRWVFDKNGLDEWDIKEKMLPEDAVIINKPPSIWVSDPLLAYALVAIIVLCVLISVGLTIFLNTYNKQKAHLESARELLERDEKLREVKERLERIINTAPLSYMLTISGTVLEANEYLQKTIGIKPGDEILPYYADPNKRRDLLAQVESIDLVENDIVEFKMPGGGKHRFLTNVSSIEYEGSRGYMLWSMDIEEMERRKDELSLARENLQTIIDVLPTPIAIYSLDDGLVIYMNRAAYELFELDPETVVEGMPVSDLLAPEQPGGIDALELLRSHSMDKTAIYELVCRKTGGGDFYCLVTSCNIEYRGKTSSLGMLKDLTAEREYARMLRDTAEKEKEANVLKSRFLVNMSHEIRTPMNAIIGLTEIELRKDPPRHTKEIYSKINGSAKNLLNIINDILDLSKIEADKIELFEEQFELEEAVSSSLLVATPRIDDKDVELMLNVSLDLPRYLIGDRTRLWQILKNFLDNAAKYTEVGKIVLTVFEVKSRASEDMIYVKFIVEDTGIGMSEEQLQKLFIPYVQIYNDAQKRYTGSGLGMAISKRLCELMGGELQVDSKPGEGTCVIITIPFKRSQQSETELEAVTIPSLAGQKILAVDDDEISLGIMETIFAASGARCDVASSGEEALTKVFGRRDAGSAYDIILLDYMMNGISGLETARRIHSGLSNAPRLLMVTAYQRLLLREDLQTSGIDDIIEKPFIPSVFIRKVVNALSGHNENIPGELPQLDELPQFRDVCVLLCEDYYLNQEVAVGIFEQFGIKTVVAENGKVGLEKLTAGESFDLIFMDLQMPVMDGYETAKAIRAERRFDDIPIISLTADAMKEVADRCIQHGMNDHIAKPIELDHVEKVLLKWLPESKRAKAAPAPARTAGNTDEVLLRFGGDRGRYERALSEFSDSLQDKWPDFDVSALDTGILRREVHRIKGAAGNLSETELYQSADLLESSLRAGSPDRGFYERFTGACAELKKRLADRAASEEANRVWTVEELHVRLDRLEAALSRSSPRGTSEAVRELRSRTLPEAGFDALLKLAATYEFDSALEALAEVRGRLS